MPGSGPSSGEYRVCDGLAGRCAYIRGLFAKLSCVLPIVAVLLAPLATVRALDPQKQIGQYSHQSWTSQNGLPGETVYQVLQSKDGYLWVRTGSGLARFDGVRFVSIDEELGSEPVKAICLSADGDLLIRTASRTVIYKDRRFADYLPRHALLGGDIRVIFESREHVLFVGGDYSISRLDPNGDPKLLSTNTGWIFAFLEDRSGTVWIAGASGLYTYKDGKMSAPFDTTALNSTVTSLIEDRQHQLWAGTAKGLFRLTVNGSAIRLSLQSGMPADATAVLEDKQGSLWIATKTLGLTRFANGRFSSFDYAAGLSDNMALSLFEDREGDIWIGTAAGLDQLRDASVTAFTNREGLPSNVAKSAIAMRDGSLTAFTDIGGLVNIRNGIVTSSQQNARLPSTAGQALFASRDGSLWIGTLKGLSRIKDGKLTVYSGGGHFSRSFISTIFEDDESLIVTNAESRAFRLQGGKVSLFTVGGNTTPISDGGVYTFTEYRDPAGTLWFGTSNGLFKLPSAEEQGSGKQPDINFDVTNIYDDLRGNLWLGGRTPGLVQFRIRDGRVTRYTRANGLFDDNVSRVLADDGGNLWISTANGIYSASQKDLDGLADGKMTFVQSRRYGVADGMKTAEASDVTSQPGGARTPDGKLWFTTKKGIVSIDPAQLTHNDLIPPVIVGPVVANGVVQPSSGILVIPPGITSLEIHYTALSLRNPARVRFKYQLEGYDRGWVDVGSRRAAYYTKLPPGTYQFHVIAANDDGLWNFQGDFVSIVLKPRFYQTNYFYATSLLIALLVAFAANRFNTRLISLRADQLSRLVDERTAELRESQSALELLAHVDTLTGLPNRRLFTDEFGKLCDQATRSQFTLLLIDVDDFKSINDIFGHDAGDAFLVETARRLESTVRSTDKVARLGGDEFAILLPGNNREDWLDRICDRIVCSFSAQVHFHDASFQASVSMGVALFPEHGDTQEKLFKAADLALYQAKRLGRNTWCRSGQESQGERLLE